MKFLKLVFICLYLVFNSIVSSESLNALKEQTIETKEEIKDERIIGGRDALPGECPYQAVLLANDRFICGGFFVKPNVVITAAHCVYGAGNSDLKVRYNTLKYNSGSTIQVKRAIPHPNYSARTNANDIAILILSSPFTSGSNVNFIDISRSIDPKANSVVTVSGWGRVSPASNAVSDVLQIANLSVISRERCSQLWSPLVISRSMICAIDTYRSACNGDSGGPLVQNGVIVGIVSFGSSRCLHDSLPNIYTRVSSFLTWIRRTIMRFG